MMQQFELPFGKAREAPLTPALPPSDGASEESSSGKRPCRGMEGVALKLGNAVVPLLLVRNRRARRYVLRLNADGTARVTIPRGGTAVEARRFAERNIGWLERQWLKQASQPQEHGEWRLGYEILFRGQRVQLQSAGGETSRFVRFGTESVRVKDSAGDLRSEIERHLRALAALELPARVWELAALHNAAVNRVSVRNQRSRWGSCSRRGTVSLNWRLVQAPVLVRDYIILHELAHSSEMNHSARFWRLVARICPAWQQAEAWLKENGKLLR